MAINLAAKFPGDTLTYGWKVPVSVGDSVNSYTVSITSGAAIIESDNLDRNTVTLVLSSGLAGEVSVFDATATTSRGETFAETIYLPVVSSGSMGETALDVVSFALRKIYGLGETPPADAAEHALECLSDMLEEWRTSGADVGAPSPILTSSVIHCQPAFMRAIKNNLIVAASEIFDREITATVAQAARSGLIHVKWANLPDERRQAVYY